jgi:hypothetical protein
MESQGLIKAICKDLCIGYFVLLICYSLRCVFYDVYRLKTAIITYIVIDCVCRVFQYNKVRRVISFETFGVKIGISTKFLTVIIAYYFEGISL